MPFVEEVYRKQMELKLPQSLSLETPLTEMPPLDTPLIQLPALDTPLTETTFPVS